MRTKFNKLSGLVLAVGLELSAEAGLQVQMGGTGGANTNMIGVSTTNTYALYGGLVVYTNGINLFGTQTLSQAVTNYYDTNGVRLLTGNNLSPNAFIDCSRSSQCILEAGGFFTNSTANACTITARTYTSVGLANDDWSTGPVITFTVPANTNGWFYGQFPYSTNCPVAFGLRTFENTNSSGCTGTNLVFRGFVKTGI